ncbi:hypothetical protein MHU86_1005 [Fragilaria crotonensis]|nr:hypothetical protein MHU86_1005 [Fragilaria crotonensis]
MDDGSMPHQRQQDGDEIRSEVFEQNGSAGGDTYERNGAQEEDGVIVEQNLLRQGGGGMLQGSVVEMEDESMARSNAVREKDLTICLCKMAMSLAWSARTTIRKRPTVYYLRI